jgi:hypothetical protein
VTQLIQAIRNMLKISFLDLAILGLYQSEAPWPEWLTHRYY